MKVFSSILLLAASLYAAPPSWTPANFHGITLGHAHREDVVRTLGNPDSTSRNAYGEELLYKSRGDHKGDLTVQIDGAGIATEIQESFQVAIARTRIYKEFGNDAQAAQYSWAKCAANSLYRDPRGPLELTLYPSRGMAIWPDQAGYDFAAIHYLAHPPGLTRPPACISKR